MKGTKKRIISLALSAAFLAAALSGCGSSAGSADGSYYREDSAPTEADYDTGYYGESNDIAYEEEIAYDTEETAASGTAEVKAKDEAGASGTGDTIDQSKIVYTGSMRVETLEYDESKTRIRAAISEAGGFIESESESDSGYGWYNENASSGTRTLYMTVRVPSASFESFLSGMDGVGKVMSRSTNAENISRRYASTKTYIESLEIEQDRLLEMMDQAVTIEDMIRVEERLTEVESRLNDYRTQLASMDTDVSYSTVDLQLTEVRRYSSTPVERKSFGTRLTETIIDAWGSFLGVMEGLLYVLIYLLPYALIALVIVLIVIASRKAYLKKHPEEASNPKRMSRKERKRLQEEAMRQRFAAQQTAQNRPGMPPQGPGPQQPGQPGETQQPAPPKQPE